MAESWGHNLVNNSQNLLKSLLGHLNIDSNRYVKYQNLSSRGSQDILLTRFLYMQSRKRGITQSIFHGTCSKVNQVI